MTLVCRWFSVYEVGERQRFVAADVSLEGTILRMLTALFRRHLHAELIDVCRVHQINDM